MGEEENGGSSGDESINFELIDPKKARALPLVKKYRSNGKKLTPEMKKKLLQYVVEALLREGHSLLSKGGIVTTKTEILPYKIGKEWDLDSSLENLINNNSYDLPSYNDLQSRDVIRSQRSFIILADKSNSLGPVIDYVALAVSVLAEAVKSENYALLFFDSSVKISKSVRGYVNHADILEEILDVECKGATDLNEVFVQAKKQLDSAPAGTEGVCVMISDCIPTEGDDPLKGAQLLPKLEILLVNNELSAIGSSCADKLEKLSNVNIRKINALSDIVDTIQEIVSYGGLQSEAIKAQFKIS